MKIDNWKLKLFSTAVALVGAFAWGAASAQIANTPHNLGTSANGGTAPPATFSGTDEICVFCHTPHGSAAAEVPLWNKSLPLANTFTTYATTTSLDGEVVDVGSVSIACLSCHDGAQAMNTILNAPGSGAGGDATWTGGAWSTGTGVITGFAQVGPDLSNDHPVGVQYGGGGQTAAAPTAALNDGDFVGTQNDILNLTTTVWWVDTSVGTAGTREKTDMILYTRTDGTSGAQEPFVECASCHDPHTQNDLFLRIDNAGSAVCLACHTK